MAYVLRTLTGGAVGGLADEIFATASGALDAFMVLKIKYGAVLALVKAILIVVMDKFLKIPLPKGIVIGAWYYIGFVVGSILA